MKAIMLAAGVGKRLYGDSGEQPPKSLLEFEGETLMRRHIETLKSLGIDSLTLVLGYRADEIGAEAKAVGGDFVKIIHNPDFRRGPVVSLWLARETLRGGDDVLFMDADVLYHPSLIRRLIEARPANCFLYDEAFEHGEEPVTLCLRGGEPVEFGKKIQGSFDAKGEWPGFLKLGPAMAAGLADSLQAYIDADDLDNAYEPAMRDLLLEQPKGTFAYLDITGEPWIEIDFPEDLERARLEILPRIRDLG
ncbi:MAG: phosphocholine cytidylyltransferase family protein [Magnetospirillum sp. WYHS-4]